MADERPGRIAGLTRSWLDPSSVQQSWERWKLAWQHAFFAVALGLGTLGAVTSTGSDSLPVAVQLVLAGTLGAWYAYWFGVRRDATAAHLPYLLGAAALWAVMAALDPTLLWVGAASLVPYCMRHALWAAAGFLALGVAWLWQRLVTDGALSWATVLSCMLGVLAAVAISGYITVLDREGRKRQRLLDELEAAQAELTAAERQAGILAERQRLARDIHDTLTQGFASISMLLDATLADMAPDTPSARRVTQAMRTARENLTESRRLVEALRPAQLDGIRLPDAVRRLTSRLTEETRTSAHTVVTGDPVALDQATETGLLRVVQEALTNVRRHASAHEATVTISYLDDTLLIDVHDDGAGFAQGASQSGVGLAAMRERTDGLGGTLTLESAPGEGTTVAVAVPLPTPPQTRRDASDAEVISAARLIESR